MNVYITVVRMEILMALSPMSMGYLFILFSLIEHCVLQFLACSSFKSLFKFLVLGGCNFTGDYFLNFSF